MIQIQILLVLPLPNSRPRRRPPSQYGTLLRGAHDGEPPLRVRDKTVHEPKLNQHRDIHLHVIHLHGGVAPDQSLVGAQLLGSAGRRDERRGRIVAYCFEESGGCCRRREGGGRLGGNVAFEAVLEVLGRRVEVSEVHCCGASVRVGGVGVVLARGVGEEECSAGEGAPEQRPEAMGEDEEEALVEEVFFVLGQRVLEEDKVALADRLNQWLVDGYKG